MDIGKVDRQCVIERLRHVRLEAKDARAYYDKHGYLGRVSYNAVGKLWGYYRGALAALPPEAKTFRQILALSERDMKSGLLTFIWEDSRP